MQNLLELQFSYSLDAEVRWRPGALFSAMGMGLPVAFTTLLVAFAFGLALMAAYYMIGGISGCHINPAVSLAMLITKRMSVKDFFGYIIGQFVGGIAGAALLSVIIGGRTSLGANGYGTASTFGITMWMAILTEVILAFVFVSAFLSVTEKEENKPIAGLIVGLTMTMTYIFGVPFTGASVNPARSFWTCASAGQRRADAGMGVYRSASCRSDRSGDRLSSAENGAEEIRSGSSRQNGNH